MRIVQYTAIFGGYDQVRPPKVINDDIDYVLWTDEDVDCPPWQVREVTGVDADWSPRKKQRFVKILSHQFFSDYDIIIWHGGNIQAAFPTSWALDLLGDGDFALYRHPHRNCLYEEIKACKMLGKGDYKKLVAQRDTYREQGHPKDWGLWAAWFMIRRPTESVKKLEEAWWIEVDKHSLRDQVSLPVALRKVGKWPTEIEGNLLHSHNFKYHYDHK